MATHLPHKRAARAAAIFLLTCIGALLAVWSAPRVSEAVAAWMSAPPVRSVSLALANPLPVAGTAEVLGASPGANGGAGSAVRASGDAAAAASPVIDAGLKYTMLGVICRPPDRQGGVTVLLRTSDDGASWSRWYRVALERAAEQGGKPQTFTEPIWTGSGRYVQVAAQRAGSSGAAPARLQDVRVVAINSTEDADRGAVVVGVLRRAAVAVAGLQLAPPVGAMTSKPVIVTRQQWGADESWRSGSPSFAPVKMAFIHHTGSGNSYSASEAPAIVRAVYHYHTMSMHWSDVGYNFLIDRYGTIYEGRYGGVTKGALGAQTLGFNTGSTGISVIGTFTSATPPAAALTSLEQLLAWKLDIHHVDAQGTATLVCGYGEKYKTGQQVKFPVIAGHRDANHTDCPGGKLYGLLPEVRRVVARTGTPKIYDFVVADPVISPNGDTVIDRTAIGFTVSEAAAWRLDIRDESGQLVRHVSGEGTVVSTTWAGRDDGGRLLPDGLYSVSAEADSASGAARAATGAVGIDTTPPRVSGVVITPEPFSPNGDGQDDVATLTFVPSESGTARVSVIGADGVVLRRLTGWKAVGPSARQVRWDGGVKGGSGLEAAAEGPATLALEVRDAAGNTATARRRLTVDRTLRFTSLSRAVFSPNGDGKHDVIRLRFALTRAADVTAIVSRAGATVRSMHVRKLKAGSRSVTWNGALSGGGKAANGSYTLKVTAVGSVGVTSVVKTITVDRAKPRVTAPGAIRVRRGKTAKIAFSVRDPFSSTVKVNVTITDATNQVIGRIALGWVKPGVTQTCSWKPRDLGVYTLAFRAQDRGGNRQAAVVKTVLTAC